MNGTKGGAYKNRPVGMVGDLQAIAGKAMPDIPSLDMPMLESPALPERKASGYPAALFGEKNARRRRPRAAMRRSDRCPTGKSLPIIRIASSPVAKNKLLLFYGNMCFLGRRPALT
jgi:hypothetical protein